ncbi:group II intron maturase-specific domain-containing protein [Clostridium beijerinckii]
MKSHANKNKEISIEYRLLKLNQILRGWINYYGVANSRKASKTRQMD